MTSATSWSPAELDSSVPSEHHNEDPADAEEENFKAITRALEQLQKEQLHLWRAHQDLRDELLQKIVPATQNTPNQGTINVLPAQPTNRGLQDNGALARVEQTASREISAMENMLTHGISSAEEVTADSTNALQIDSFSFRHSVWDAAVFIGYDHMAAFDFLETAANSFLLLLNVVVQGCFVVIVSHLAESSLDDETIDGYRKWRTLTGHAVHYMDRLTEQSLASRVCMGDPSLHLSDTQAAQVRSIRAYLEDCAPFNGPMMCVLGVLAWMLTVCTEFLVLKDMLKACMSLPRGQTSVKLQGKRLQLMSLSSFRLFYIVLLALLRAGIAGALLFFGIQYLIVTISVEEILLNAVALQFVLQVDESLYQALTPRKTRRFILKMRTIPLARMQQWRGLDWDSILVSLAIISMFAALIPLYMEPHISKMRAAEHELCDGLLEFSYSVTPAYWVAWASEKNSTYQLHASSQSSWSELQNKIHYEVIRSIIDRRSSENMWANSCRLPQLTGAGWTVDTIHKWHFEAFGERFNTGCRDLLTSGSVGNPITRVQALASLRDSIGNQSINWCEDVAPYCNDYQHGSVRLVCPVTCGCDDPGSAQVLHLPDYGCPGTCLRGQKYIFAMRSKSCKVENPQPNAFWKEFVASWRRAAKILYWPRNTSLAAQLMLSEGCGAVHSVRTAVDGLDLCEVQDMKSLQFWCPVTCNCSATFVSPIDMKNLCPFPCGQQSRYSNATM